jgi:hypothetical protein
LDLNLRKKPMKYYIWAVAVYGPEIWTLRKIYQIYLECGTEEGYKISVGPIVREMKHYKTSRRRGISYKQ